MARVWPEVLPWWRGGTVYKAAQGRTDPSLGPVCAGSVRREETCRVLVAAGVEMGPPCPGPGGGRRGGREDRAGAQVSAGRQTGSRGREGIWRCLGRYLRIRVGNVHLGAIGV